MFVLVEKPSGYTSFDLVRKLKKLYPGEKIGHAGTLDPLATGLMIIAIGKDTKQIQHYVGLDKKYKATIDFAKKSDTWDSDYRSYYEELPLASLAAPSLAAIQEKLDSILGWHALPLTPFSAKKWKGKKLYDYARAGEPIHIKVEMQLIAYEIIAYHFPLLEVRLHVGSGTYIRSIAHWLGEQWGLGGILTALHREQIGPYSL